MTIARNNKRFCCVTWLTLAAALVTMPNVVWSLACFQCTSLQNLACGDPFMAISGNLALLQCPNDLYTQCMKFISNSVTNRWCALASDCINLQAAIVAGQVYSASCCTGDGCNAAAPNALLAATSPPPLQLLTTLLLPFVLHFC